MYLPYNSQRVGNSLSAKYLDKAKPEETCSRKMKSDEEYEYVYGIVTTDTMCSNGYGITRTYTSKFHISIQAGLRNSLEINRQPHSRFHYSNEEGKNINIAENKGPESRDQIIVSRRLYYITMSIHEYFDRTYTEWSNIARSDKGKRGEKAQHLFDRYKKEVKNCFCWNVTMEYIINVMESNLSLPNFLCNVCLRLFNSECGLLLHCKTISKYNKPTEYIDILPSQTIKEFQEIFSVFSIFYGFIHSFQAKRGLAMIWFHVLTTSLSELCV
ncbi:hypothetical protein GLOIN_2v1783849 [Rhizophagus clarus]|uniref:C2H2-type domain-containing protein n=1 Tax=Rhizophagus clarus TaxID=94130 RepID=A0A8H3LBA2_9GLOM|nr:hypothetical protein GLOIN_2v1783849 [Rhizophagus clarus]